MRGLAWLLAAMCTSAFAQTLTFQNSLYPVLQTAGCPNCHNANGVASATRLHFPEDGAPADRIEAFGKSLVRLVDRAQPDQSLLLKKPTMRIPHTGGQRIQPGSTEEAALKRWISVLAGLSGDDLARAMQYSETENTARVKPSVVLRRMTHSQYNHTVRDLLGDQSLPANTFPPEDFVNGFKDQYSSQNLSPILVEAYGNAAEKLAAAAFRPGTGHSPLHCSPSAACRDSFIRDFGLQAFRRPLSANEQKRYAALLSSEPNFAKGAQLVVEAMLQSPNFLFRLDETSDPRLQPYAVASRLSYALWDSMPDRALLQAAKENKLSSQAGLQKIARQMLQDPRAHEALDEYVAEWLRFDRLLTSSRDRRRYPKFRQETAIAMTEEARQFVSDLVWNNSNFMEAFTARYGFMNGELASIYGAPAPAKDFERVSFPVGSGRAGLLGQALFLSLSSKPDDSSITGRGLFVREQFLCQHVPPPPAGVNTNLAPSTENHPQTNRERMAEHVGNQFCSGCHNLMDPIGAGFEQFDAVGARREKYRLLFYSAAHGERRKAPKTADLPLDTNGWVAGLPGARFSSPEELGSLLAKTPQCQECMVKQYFRYISGRLETSADLPTIRKITADFRKSKFQFQELILSLVGSWSTQSTEGRGNVAGNYEAPTAIAQARP